MQDAELAGLVERLARSLIGQDLRLATAESCTGGWLAKVCTDLAGSSAWFERGFVTYSNESKQELLGVQAAVLDEHGAVSAATVRAMVAGTLAHSRADLAVAISGLAGPGGGTQQKPVGSVFIAWSKRDGRAVVSQSRFSGDREGVRRASIRAALEGLLALIDQ